LRASDFVGNTDFMLKGVMEVNRKIIRGFINGSNVKLNEIDLENTEIINVYTIINEDNLFPKFNSQTGEPISERSLDNVVLQHHYSVFVEDILHDWNVVGDTFRFHGHSGNKGTVHDLLIEYK
jgi:hypothetical protein